MVLSALVVGCSGAAEDEQLPEVTDIAEVDVEPEPDPEPEVEPEPEDPDPDGELDSEPQTDPDTYDGFPIDQPVTDVSVIDEAYVEEVLAVLDMNFLRLVLAIEAIGADDFDTDNYITILPEMTSTAVEDLEIVMAENITEFLQEGWFQTDPSQASSVVEELLTVEDDCISAAVLVDAESLYTVPLSGRWYVGFAPRAALTEEAGTIWRFLGRGPDRGEVRDVCA